MGSRKTVKLSMNPFQLSQEIYSAIGEVTVSWSALESLVGAAMTFMLKTDRASFIAVTSNMNIGAQINSALTLCQLVIPESDERTALVDVFNRVGTMSKERNKIVHGKWQQGKSEKVAVCITARAHGDPIEVTEMKTAASLRNFAGQIREACEDLTAACIRAGLYAAPDPLPHPAERTVAL